MGLSGIIIINQILVPILILLVIILGYKYNVFGINYNIETQASPKWLWSSILYAGFNGILVLQMLVPLKQYIKNKKQCKIISLICGIIIFILGFIVYKLVNIIGDDAKNIQLPIIFIASSLGNRYKVVYGILIFIAIYTSAVSTGFAFLKNVTKTEVEYKKIALAVCVAGIIVSNFEFSKLVSFMYPIFGYIGIMQIIFMQNYLQKSL